MTITITKAIAEKVLTTVDKGLSSGLGTPTPGNMCVEAAVCYALGLPHGDDPSCVSRAVRALKIALNDSSWSSKEARAKGMRRLALVQLGSAGAICDKDFAKRVAELSIRLNVPVALRAAASIHPDTHHKGALLDAALLCEKNGTESAARSAAESARSAAESARSAARSAAESAARSAAESAARSAARSAAESAAWSAARSAAWSAAESAARSAWSAARSAAWSAAESASDKHLSNFAEGVVQILVSMEAPGAEWLYLTEQNKEHQSRCS